MFMTDAEDQEQRDGVLYTKNEVYQEMLTSVDFVTVEDVPYLRDYESDEECEVSDVDEDCDMGIDIYTGAGIFTIFPFGT